MFQDRDQEPVVKQLTSDPVEIKDNHFSQPLERSDSSRGAMNFPIPEVRYLIKEISVIWHLYGGKDFGSAPSTASPARSRGWAVNCLSVYTAFEYAQTDSDYLSFSSLLWRSTPHSSPSQTPIRQAKASGRAGGGKGRNPDVLMEIQLSKAKLLFTLWYTESDCIIASSLLTTFSFTSGEISAWSVPTVPAGFCISSGSTSFPAGVCCAGLGDSRQTGYITDEQVSLLVL